MHALKNDPIVVVGTPCPDTHSDNSSMDSMPAVLSASCNASQRAITVSHPGIPTPHTGVDTCCTDCANHSNNGHERPNDATAHKKGMLKTDHCWRQMAPASESAWSTRPTRDLITAARLTSRGRLSRCNVACTRINGSLVGWQLVGRARSFSTSTVVWNSCRQSWSSDQLALHKTEERVGLLNSATVRKAAEEADLSDVVGFHGLFCGDGRGKMNLLLVLTRLLKQAPFLLPPLPGMPVRRASPSPGVLGSAGLSIGEVLAAPPQAANVNSPCLCEGVAAKRRFHTNTFCGHFWGQQNIASPKLAIQ